MFTLGTRQVRIAAEYLRGAGAGKKLDFGAARLPRLEVKPGVSLEGSTSIITYLLASSSTTTDACALQWLFYSSDLHSMVCTYVLGKTVRKVLGILLQSNNNFQLINDDAMIDHHILFSNHQDLAKEAITSEKMVKQILDNINNLLLVKTYLVCHWIYF